MSDDEDAPGWAAPPVAPFPTADGTSRRRLTPRGGHRRRKASGVGAIAVVVIAGARLLLANADDPSTDFSLPERIEGPPVEATPLTSGEVCEVLTPADLRQVYDRRFQPGAPVETSSASSGGEPSAGGAGGLGETGICRWQTKPGEEALTVVALSVPAIGGDANRTYEVLRPSSPIQGFDSTSDIGDEAFFLMDPITPTSGYSDTMTLRSGGVVLTVNVTGATKPAGGLDLLAEVGQVAASNLAPAG